jgi:hypothetical protein
MTLAKGFLTGDYSFKKSNLIGSLFLWIVFAYIIYALFQLSRESFRVFTLRPEYTSIVTLSSTENFYYNLFFASLASALGYMIVLKFFLENSILRNIPHTRSFIRRTLEIQGLYTWGFLFWFCQLGIILGVLYLTVPMVFELRALTDFSMVLLLLPMILFYSSWPMFNRVVRRNKAYWFFGITSVFFLLSGTFSLQNFTDYKKINEFLLSPSIENVYDLKKPRSITQNKYDRVSQIINIFVVKDTLETEEPVIYLESINNRIFISEIRNLIRSRMEDIHYIPYDIPIPNLHIDKRISLEDVKALIHEFRMAGLKEIQFSTDLKYSRYPSNYPGFFYTGINKFIGNRYFKKLTDFLDSAEQLDLTGKQIRLSESLMYRQGFLKKINRIEIHVSQDTVTLNGQEVDPFRLEQIVHGFIQKYSPNFVIIYNPDDDISFGRYITYLDLLYYQVDLFRNELSFNLYQRPFDELETWKNEDDTIINRYPKNILEWTKEEQRLNELVEKTNGKK